MKFVMNKIFLAIIFLVSCGSTNAQNPQPAASPEEAALRKAISAYQSGLINNDLKLFLSSLGKEIFMFGGNFSDDQTKWQAHLFRRGKDLRKFAENFLTGAGPHRNSVEFLSFHVRGSAAVVVTKETGRNKFREWTDETVTWLLGKRDGNWKIVGFFIRDVKNPV